MPSVEFSTGTTPRSALPARTSVITDPMSGLGTRSASRGNTRRAASWE